MKNKNLYSKSDKSQLLGIEDPKLIVYELLNGLNLKLELTKKNFDKGDIEKGEREQWYST